VQITLHGWAGCNYVDGGIMMIIIIQYIMWSDRVCVQLHFAVCCEIGVKLDGWSLSESFIAVLSKKRPDRITRYQNDHYSDWGYHHICTVTITPSISPSFTIVFIPNARYPTVFLIFLSRLPLKTLFLLFSKNSSHLHGWWRATLSGLWCCVDRYKRRRVPKDLKFHECCSENLISSIYKVVAELLFP
jgi:hypothetical protein